MTKALLKKQMMEVFSWLYKDRKTGKLKNKKSTIITAVLYLLLFVFLGAFFIFLSLGVAPLIHAGEDTGWLYWGIMGGLSVFLGVFGSVFNTYASLYKAKDNDILLSMPIPPFSIMAARLSGVYAMGLLYELIVIIPAIAVWFMNIPFGILSTIFSILIPIVLSVFVLVLSCILGWVVAVISVRIKNKSFITVAVSVIFIAAYYYFYSKAYSIFQSIIASANDPEFAARAKVLLYPLYHMGRAAEGNALSMIVFTLIVAVCFGIVVFVISKSFLRLATANSGEKIGRAKMQQIKVNSLNRALFKKELKRFTGSASYMLNCGISVFLMIIAAAFLIIKSSVINAIVPTYISKDLASVAAMGIVFLLVGSVIIAAPSVSLEGKNLWILSSFPINGRDVVKAKLLLHFVLAVIPALLLTAVCEIIIKPGLVIAILLPLCTVLFTALTAAIDLNLGLSKPSFNWTNEVIPIKQSGAVFFSLFIGWIFSAVFAAGVYFLAGVIGFDFAFGSLCLVLAVLCLGLINRLLTKGARRFESL